MKPGNKGTWRGASWACALWSVLAIGTARAELIGDWTVTAGNVIAPMGSPTGATPEERAPNYPLDLATVHVAIYDAVNGIAQQYQPYVAEPAVSTAGASREAAANEAAYQVLLALFPSRTSLYQAEYAARMAAIPASPAKTLGQAVGANIAAQVVDWRRNDGRATVVAPFVPGVDPGEFQGVNPLVNATVPYVRPFALSSASQFRPDGPYALDSEEYAADYNEVQSLGASNSLTRTPEQTDVALFGTDPPPLFWPRNLSRLTRDTNGIVGNARLMAMLWVAQADAVIACFEAKYHFYSWRPRTAIPAGDTDGNAATLGDTGWLPAFATPNHPEYPAAHSCTSASAMEILRRFYGTKKIAFSFDTATTGLPKYDYKTTDEFVEQIANARVWAGIHFRHATEDGAELGRQVSKWVLKNHFRAIDDHSHGVHHRSHGGHHRKH